MGSTYLCRQLRNLETPVPQLWSMCSGGDQKGGPEGDGSYGWQWSLPLSSLLFPGESNATADGWGLEKKDPAGNCDILVGFHAFFCIKYQLSKAMGLGMERFILL